MSRVPSFSRTRLNRLSMVHSLQVSTFLCLAYFFFLIVGNLIMSNQSTLGLRMYSTAPLMTVSGCVSGDPVVFLNVSKNLLPIDPGSVNYLSPFGTSRDCYVSSGLTAVVTSIPSVDSCFAVPPTVSDSSLTFALKIVDDHSCLDALGWMPEASLTLLLTILALTILAL
jgi:hypothetical protein